MCVYFEVGEMTRSDWINRQEQTAEDKGKTNGSRNENGKETGSRQLREQETRNRERINHPTVLCNYFCAHQTDVVIPIQNSQKQSHHYFQIIYAINCEV